MVENMLINMAQTGRVRSKVSMSAYFGVPISGTTVVSAYISDLIGKLKCS
ncbi:uncharacterized protein DEA37_0010969 [Paragonimus westermani]|uniref:Uncharacterized protein n=1 Tax=Paragonimus westermani TaxID=34504 RepID=A0A5J4N517_9TREM|nr:uncharacterized protein DEA37_0010969 [Paragonimus westermani]